MSNIETPPAATFASGMARLRHSFAAQPAKAGSGSCIVALLFVSPGFVLRLMRQIGPYVPKSLPD